jgi:hypothetical protein
MSACEHCNKEFDSVKDASSHLRFCAVANTKAAEAKAKIEKRIYDACSSSKSALKMISIELPSVFIAVDPEVKTQQEIKEIKEVLSEMIG